MFSVSAAWALYRWGAVILAPVLLCLLIGSCVSGAGWKHKAGLATAERDQARLDYNVCRQNRITLETALSSQNAAVVAMRDADAQQAADAAEAVSEARRATDDANRRVARIMAARPSGAACVADDADRLILETVR
jgi:hypothetical protein